MCSSTQASSCSWDVGLPTYHGSKALASFFSPSAYTPTLTNSSPSPPAFLFLPFSLSFWPPTICLISFHKQSLRWAPLLLARHVDQMTNEAVCRSPPRLQQVPSLGILQSLTAAVLLIASRKPGASVLSVLQSGQRISDMGRDSQRHPASAVTCFKILHAISGSEQHLGRGLTLLRTRNAWLQGSLIAISEEWPYRAFALALWEAMWHWATTFSSAGTLN